MCGNECIVKHSVGFREIFRLRCKSWNCAYCAPRRRKRLIAGAINGKPNTFITLTLPADRRLDPAQAVKDLSRAWRLIRKRDARRRNGKPVPFLAVVELTKVGTPHLHIICRAKWIDQKWLSNCMAEIADAPIVHIARIDNMGRVAMYCGKYISKDTAKVGTNKRYWQSQDYALEDLYEKPPLQEGEFWGNPIMMGIKRFVAIMEDRGWVPRWINDDNCIMEPSTG